MCITKFFYFFHSQSFSFQFALSGLIFVDVGFWVFHADLISRTANVLIFRVDLILRRDDFPISHFFRLERSEDLFVLTDVIPSLSRLLYVCKCVNICLIVVDV